MRTFPFASDPRPAISNLSQPDRGFTLCCRLFALGLGGLPALFSRRASLLLRPACRKALSAVCIRPA